jgi:hypothetical protein
MTQEKADMTTVTTFFGGAALAAFMTTGFADPEAEGTSDRYELKQKLESPLPAGFPQPGPPGVAIVKEYPASRAVRTDRMGTAGSNASFWSLFMHIKRNKISMTSPVEFTLDERRLGEIDRGTHMAFFYGDPSTGATGIDSAQGAARVEVVDVPTTAVVSVGIEGPLTSEKVIAAAAALEWALHSLGGLVVRSGSFRLLNYHSPFVPAAKRYYELQLPVRALTAEGSSAGPNERVTL